MQEITQKLRAEDGHQIGAVLWRPESTENCHGIICLSHGMAEHYNRYRHFAESLTQAGWLVVAHDHRGHGRSVDEGILGHFADNDGWRLALSDLDQVITQYQKAYPSLPMILFGHSMGATMVMNYLLRSQPNISGLALSAITLTSRATLIAALLFLQFEKLRVGKQSTSEWIDKLSFGHWNSLLPNTETAFDFISRDKNVIDAYMKDSYSGFLCTAQFWQDFIEGFLYIHRTSRYRKIPSQLPIYLLTGGDDPIGDFGKGIERLNHALVKTGHDDVTCRTYENGRHEMLNELNREEVINDLISWLNRVSATSPFRPRC